jgi:hypothetical protein
LLKLPFSLLHMFRVCVNIYVKIPTIECMFRAVFWVVQPCKRLSADVSEVRTASIRDDGGSDDGGSTHL